MDYYQVRFEIKKENEEVLVAFLAEAGFDMFEEFSEGILAYIPENGRSLPEIEELVKSLSTEITGASWQVSHMADRNWNEEWEKSFEPVIIAGRVMVRAPFHPAPSSDLIDLVIEPKMSFGTGHHPTTALMIESMLGDSWEDVSVLDMGCGSGVLAILAFKLGAKQLLAIDIDDWAVENTAENVSRNDCTPIAVEKGNSSLLTGRVFDRILANINRNILLHDLTAYASALNVDGRLYISGFLTDDADVLTRKAAEVGLAADGSLSSDNWMMLKFVKSTKV
ncbi:MAG: ribosomal protein methyltransferase [Bacteroidota bacterium]|jgi:ribosomal protein L11 methyltransferase